MVLTQDFKGRFVVRMLFVKTPGLKLGCSSAPCAKAQGALELIAGIVFLMGMLVTLCSVSCYLFIEHSALTAAREGTRLAALTANLTSGNTAAINQIKARVQQAMLASSGQVVASQDITVTPPSVSAPVGNRTVSVRLSYPLATPLSVANVLSGWGAEAHHIVSVPVVAAATMRYEE